MKLDKSTKAKLGFAARSTKDLAFFGLNGRAVHSAMPGFATAESAELKDRFGNAKPFKPEHPSSRGTVAGLIVDPGEFNGEALNEHSKGGFYSRPVKERKKAVIVDGNVITHRELKGRHVSTGVYFPVEEEFVQEEKRHVGRADESLTCDREPAQWNEHRQRVDMAGTIVSRPQDHSGQRKRAKRHEKRA